MGCGAISKTAEEERKIKKVADEFRAKLVREVSSAGLRCTTRSTPELNTNSGRSSATSPTSPTMFFRRGGGSEEADDRRKASLKSLRSFGHLERHSINGDTHVERQGDITLTVPGNVGVADSKVVIQTDSSQMLLRTRRVHKYTKRAKKMYARRGLKNLETKIQDIDEEMECSDMSPEEILTAIRALEKNFLSASLQHDEHAKLVKQVQRIELVKGDVICRHGESGDCCFIVLSGICSVKANTDQIAQLTAGHMFGELSMLYETPRTATVVAASQRVVACKIGGSAFRRSLTRFKESKLSDTLGFLNGHELFSKLTLEEKRLFANALCPETFLLGSSLIGEGIGRSAGWLYLIQEGSVEITDEYGNRKVLGEGATFCGQRTPYSTHARTSKALTKLRVLSIGEQALSRLFGNTSRVLRIATRRHLLEDWPMFLDLTCEQKMVFVGTFQEQQFKRGEVVVSAGANPQIVIVNEGEVVVVDLSVYRGSCIKKENVQKMDDVNVAARSHSPANEPDNEPESENAATSEMRHGTSILSSNESSVKGVVKILRIGEYYGTEYFREGCCMEYSLIAKRDCVVCRLGYDEVCRALRGCADKTLPLTQIIEKNRVKALLQSVFPFSAIYDEMLNVVLEGFETVEYNSNECIEQPASSCNRFVIVTEGEAIRIDKAGIEPIPKWASFGIAQLLLSEPGKYEIRAAATGCKVEAITTEKFQEACGVLFNELAMKEKYQQVQVCKKDVVKIAHIGEGQFGTVASVYIRGFFVEKFALKKMHKMKVLKEEQQAAVKLEREILADCCHPLIVRYVTTFQDARSVYILMEELMGGDLFTAIRDIGELTEEHSLFFSASLVLAIEYLHSRRVIYRDLKPENVMLTATGFVKLVDMGCCTKKVRSYTFIGTPEYLAPEVVLGVGYGKNVDWWSVGVIMYEMTCGPLPFGDGCSDLLEIMKEVLEKPLVFPKKVQPEASDLISSLLERMPEQRFGSSIQHGAKEVKEHHYFDLLNWDAILGQTLDPPYDPCVDKNVDAPERCLSMPLVERSSSLAPQETPQVDKRFSLDCPSDLSVVDRKILDVAPESDEDVEAPPSGQDVSCFELF